MGTILLSNFFARAMSAEASGWRDAAKTIRTSGFSARRLTRPRPMPRLLPVTRAEYPDILLVALEGF